ncbi:MAG: hypothetical protein JSV63_03090 [Candidatus Aenigmatarchaeota archaeon]|nr:MAG: hypothetical protein JSV63_03090 [Candidatus Aenigmarchaeota archaeon]
MVARNVKFAIIGMVIVATIFISTTPLFLALISPGRVTLSSGEPVGVQHVNQIVQDLITDDIRANYLPAERLEMEFLITPENSYFTVVIDVRTPTTKAGRASDPDVRFTVGREVVERLLSAQDFFAEVKKLNSEGAIKMEMLKPLDELLDKGYGEIYDQIVK